MFKKIEFNTFQPVITFTCIPPFRDFLNLFRGGWGRGRVWASAGRMYNQVVPGMGAGGGVEVRGGVGWGKQYAAKCIR